MSNLESNWKTVFKSAHFIHRGKKPWNMQKRTTRGLARELARRADDKMVSKLVEKARDEHPTPGKTRILCVKKLKSMNPRAKNDYQLIGQGLVVSGIMAVKQAVKSIGYHGFRQGEGRIQLVA